VIFELFFIPQFLVVELLPYSYFTVKAEKSELKINSKFPILLLPLFLQGPKSLFSFKIASKFPLPLS
jgi:hypothetical protein